MMYFYDDQYTHVWCDHNCKKIVALLILSHGVSSGSDITLCNKIDKPQVVYRFSGNVMMFIITLCKKMAKS